jgi:PTS system mannose-specific IID component
MSAILVGVPLIMASGLSTGAAIAVALPIGLIFAQLNSAQQIVNSINVRVADKAAEKGNPNGIYWAGIGLPWVTRIFTNWLPLTVLIYLGGSVAQGIADNIPSFLQNGLAAVGSIMPAVGIGIILYVMRSMILVPFMFAGYFLVQYTGVSSIGAALVGSFFAFLYWMFKVQGKNTVSEGISTEEEVAGQKTSYGNILTKIDRLKTFLLWFCFSLASETWERKQGLNFGTAMTPSLKKLYKDDPEGLKEGLTRELQFFNTESVFGACIPGVALAMEEQKALGAPIKGESIAAVKTGLMGPLAGIGDSIDWGLMYILIIALCLPAAANGNGFVAVLPPIIFGIWGIIVAYFMFNLGYKSSVKSAQSLLKGGLFSSMIPVLTVLGMFMIGAMAAAYVTVSTPLEISLGSGLGSVPIQRTLNSIVPGILPLCAVFISYFVTKKFQRFVITALVMLGIGILLGCLGIIK